MSPTATNGTEPTAATNGHTFPESSSEVVNIIMKRRAEAGKLVAGIGAASDSDMFKGPVSSI